MHRNFLLLIVVLMLLLPAQVFAATATASLERNPIRIDETVRLIISVDDHVSNQLLDVSPLEKDFNVQGSSRSTHMSIVNGRKSSSTRWLVRLEPKREGAIPIPPVFVGRDQTNPLNLMVMAATAPGDGEPRDVFIDVQAEPQTPYVQGQISYIIRLYVSSNVIDGSLNEPRAGDSVIQKLGDDVLFDAKRDDKRYRVVERRYAIFPQKSGTLEIEPIRFLGQITDPNKNGVMRNRLLRSREVQLRSEAITVEVKPQPPEFSGQNWLPARGVALVETWSDQELNFRVGEPITRTITLKATGLESAQIPDVEMEETTGFRTYPDQGEEGDEFIDKWLIGIRSQSVAFVPTQSGSITIPEVRVPWWDVTTEEQRVATIPARTVNVAAAVASAPQTNSEVTAQTTDPLTNADTIFPAALTLQNGLLWPIIAAVAMCLWLLTLLMWWLDKRKTHLRPDSKTESPQLNELVRAIKSACRNNDAPAVRKWLIKWSQNRWPEAGVADLAQISQRLDNPDLTSQLGGLDKSLYASPHTLTNWHGNALWKAFDKAHRAAVHTRPEQVPTALPKLYPEAA